MIKKINYTIICSTLVLSFVTLFLNELNLVNIAKTLSIIITINSCFILKKIIKKDISPTLELTILIFVFMAHFLGTILDFYHQFYFYDKVMHTLSGVLVGMLVINLIPKTKYRPILILLISLSVASCWEFFEYFASIIFKTDPQNVKTTGVSDTMNDMIVATLGSSFVSIYDYLWLKEKV